jgi:hypothetical protein
MENTVENTVENTRDEFPEEKIIQITSMYNPNSEKPLISGLGEDGRSLFYWSYDKPGWKRYV